MNVFNFMDLALRGEDSVESIVTVLRECSRVRMGGGGGGVYQLLRVHSSSNCC